jgi:hypothetical protein
MEFIIGLYLVGYFISVGIAFGFKEEKDSWLETFGFGLFLGTLSWINVGLIIGDVCKKYLKEPKSINNEQ